MYVMNKKWDSVTNIAQCTSVYVSPEHEIKAVPTGGGAVYRLGQYETAEIARAVLNDLYIHIATGCTYQMPNDQRARVLVREDGGRAGHQACAAGCFEPERNFPPHERNLSKQKEDCLRNPPRKAILLYLN